MNRPYKIVIVTPFGAEPRLDHFAEFILAKKLQELGHVVQFYTYRVKSDPYYRSNQPYQGIKVFRCRQRLGIAPGLFFSILRFRPDVVMYFHPKSFLSFPAFLATRLCGAKIISEIVGILHDPFIVGDTDNPLDTIKPDVRLLTTWRQLFRSMLTGNFISNWTNFISHIPIAQADTIVAINQEEQRFIKKFYHRDSTLIHWAIPKDTTLKAIQPSAQTCGTIPKDYLLFIAQIKKRKGWDTVLEGLTILKQLGVKKNLVFVCPTQDVSEAKQYAQKLGVESQIFFLSGISNEEKKWLLEHCQAVLAPSRYEGFGLPVFEGLRAGRPVLATNTKVYQELLRHGVDSLLSPIGDAEALAKNIHTLDENPVLQSTLIANGYRTITRYTEEIMTEKFLAEIAQLLKR